MERIDDSIHARRCQFVQDDGTYCINGKSISGSNMDDLTDQEIVELCQTNASKYDVLIMRKQHHELRDSLQHMYNWKQELDEALNVEVDNGKKVKKPLGQAFKDDREDMKSFRFIGRLVNNAFKYWYITLILLLLYIIFNEEIKSVVDIIYELLIKLKSIK